VKRRPVGSPLKMVDQMEDRAIFKWYWETKENYIEI